MHALIQQVGSTTITYFVLLLNSKRENAIQQERTDA
jgi:hypothetical protein